MPYGPALLAYLPPPLLTLLHRAPAPFPAPPWEDRFMGGVIFVDIQGFTPLTEFLAKSGTAGTERLTDIVNRFFQWLVTGIETIGGYVAQFNGDAIIAVIPHADATEAFQVAVRGGMDLIQLAFRHPPEVIEAQDFPLRIKVGISAGPIYSAALGNVDGELRYLVAGNAVLRASTASEHCGPMELLVPALHRDILPPDVTTLDAPEGHLAVLPALLRPFSGPIRVRRIQTVAITPLPPLQRLARFVPSPVEERLRLGLSELVAEHRPVTVMFVRFEGIDIDGPGCGEQLQRFLAESFGIVAEFEGTVDKLEHTEKGSLIMVLFGAPRAVEFPERQALLCGLKLRNRFFAKDGPRIAGIGINSGMVYVGDVGAPWRHDFTVMGDAVNTASRLTGIASRGEILVSGRVQHRTSEFCFGEHQLVSLKGKSEPIAVWLLHSEPGPEENTDPDVVTLPDRGSLMVGRNRELQILESAVERLKHGLAGIIILEGDQGVGKTHLVNYVASRAYEFARVVVQRFHADPDVPYGIWRWPLRDLFTRDDSDLEASVKSTLVGLDPSAPLWLAVLNPLLGTHFPTSPTLENAELRSRERRLFDLVATLIRHHASYSPLLLLLDDFHDADSASSALLKNLLLRIGQAPVLFLVVGRYGAPFPPLDESPGQIRMTVNTLARPYLQTLLEHWNGAKIAEPLFDAIWEKSQGNPLFAEELLHSLIAGETETITPDSPNPSTYELPDSLRVLLHSRIDLLPESARVIAKVASVIATRFSLAMVNAGFREKLDPSFLQQQLDSLIKARVLILSKSGSDIFFEFRHVLIREVLYSTLTQIQLSELHRRIGEWLEALEQTASPAVLAHHFELGRDYEKAIRYHLLAADLAYTSFANDESLRSRARALDLAEQFWIPLPHGKTRAQVLEEQGDVYFRIGAYQKAEPIYRNVRRIVPDWLGVVRCLRKEAESHCRSDNIPSAVRCSNEALLLLKAELGFDIWEIGFPLLYRLVRDFWSGPKMQMGRPPPLAEQNRLSELDHVYSVLSLALYYEGSRQLVEGVFRMAKVAVRLGTPGRIARAYGAIALIYATAGLFRQSRRYADAALVWLDREPDEVQRVQLRGTITYALVGAAHRINTRWDAAESMQLECVALNETIGDIWEESLGLINLAIMWRYRGYLHRSRELLQQVLELGPPEAHHLYRSESLLIDGFCLSELGHFEQARAQITQVMDRTMLNPLSRVRGLAYLGWNYYLKNDLSAAMDLVQECVQGVRARKMVGEHVAEIMLLCLEIGIQAGAATSLRWQMWWLAYQHGRRLPAFRGSFCFLKGLLALKRHQLPAAQHHFTAATVHHRSCDRGREAARSLYYLASCAPKLRTNLEAQAAALLVPRNLSAPLPATPSR